MQKEEQDKKYGIELGSRNLRRGIVEKKIKVIKIPEEIRFFCCGLNI